MVGKRYIMRNGMAQDPVRQCDLVKPSGSLASAVTSGLQFCYLPTFYNSSNNVTAWLPAQKWFSVTQNDLNIFCAITNKCSQLFHKLLHCYMFRQYRVIIRELVIWYMIWHMIWSDVIWYIIWSDVIYILHDAIRYDVMWYDMIRYDIWWYMIW
jgi:hypothetical protein